MGQSFGESVLVQQEAQEQTGGDEDEAEQVEKEHDQANRVEATEPMWCQAQGEGDAAS